MSKQKPLLARMELKDISRLKELKRIISDGFNSTDAFATLAREKGLETLAEAIITGNALCEASRILKLKKFRLWCEQNFAGRNKIDPFMKIAGRSDNLPDMKKIYVALGIIEEIQKPAEIAENKIAPTNDISPQN